MFVVLYEQKDISQKKKVVSKVFLTLRLPNQKLSCLPLLQKTSELIDMILSKFVAFYDLYLLLSI